MRRSFENGATRGGNMLRSAGIIGAMGLVFLAACNDKPRAPSGPSPASPAPAPASIRLEGPSSLAPGASAQYRAILSLVDGTTGDVTTQSTFHAVYSEVLQVADNGIATGGAQGEAILKAYYPAGTRTDEGFVFGPGTLQSSALRVLVLEPGSFRVSGVVTESGRPFPGVRVTVVSGKQAGLQTHTSSDGTYAFYGLVGSTKLAVSDEGLQPQVRSILVTDHQTVDFHLEPLPTYDSLTGDWTLTLYAALSCGPAIANAASRTFQARITQRGSQFTVDFSSPTRIILPDYPSTGYGGVGGNTIGLSLQWSGNEERNPPAWVLLDMLEPGRFVGIGGSAKGQRVGNTITGTFSGQFAVYRSPGTNYLAPGTTLESNCLRLIGVDAELHAFRLDRR